MPSRRNLLLSVLAAAASTGCTVPLPATAAGQLVDVHLVDRQRRSLLTEYLHGGSTWVAGRPGDRYAVRLHNRSNGRVLVVLSVDGVNAITGETAAVGQTGYVLEPFQAAEITGWRKTDAEAAAFYFTALPDAYAARTGRPQNVGVIGAAVFRERVVPPRPSISQPTPFAGRGEASRDDAGPVGNAAGRAPATAPGPIAADSMAPPEPAPAKSAERLGTGHGEREYAPIERVGFERASSAPAEVVQVRYDSHANLVAMGVIPTRWGRADPAAFPGYVPDPPRD